MLRLIAGSFLIWIGSSLSAQTLPKVRLTDSLYLLAGIETAKQGDIIQAIYNRQTQWIRDSGLLYNAVTMKSKAPDFTVRDAKGKTFHLADEVLKGPVILLWYQGGWNAYCTMALRYFQAYRNEFKKYGAVVVALTPEWPEKLAATKIKNKITFDVFHDRDNAVAKQYRIVYTLNDTLRENLETRYRLSKFIGENRSELPLPAVYLIQPNGRVAFVFLDADHTKRAEPSEFLRVLSGMGFPERK